MRGRGSTMKEVIEALLIAVIFVNFARGFVVQAFKIPSESMKPTLLVGDHLMVNKFVFGAAGDDRMFLPFKPIERGDLVVFRYPEDPEVDFVKRVIALPGETIEIANKSVWIDGQRLDEPYVRIRDRKRMPKRDDFGPLTMGENEYFVMGDHRDESNDSRYWGPVPRELITGYPEIIYWSFDRKPPPEGSPLSLRLREMLYVSTHLLSDTRRDRVLVPVPEERPSFDFRGR
ncbi:MAG: signal peptidase I [Thermoanaerobaculia bacterium]|nr:signal peptidase I [Thermoanaerobaculia bacterium]